MCSSNDDGEGVGKQHGVGGNKKSDSGKHPDECHLRLLLGEAAPDLSASLAVPGTEGASLLRHFQARGQLQNGCHLPDMPPCLDLPSSRCIKNMMYLCWYLLEGTGVLSCPSGLPVSWPNPVPLHLQLTSHCCICRLPREGAGLDHH